MSKGFLKQIEVKINENSKNAKKIGFLPPNPSGRFFLFLAVIGFFSSNHGACYIKSRAHAPNGQQHRTPGMPCLVERFSQRSGGYLLRKCTVFMEKTAIHLSRYEKSIAYK